eukprot:7381249-Prymnesium_polylepis.1
MGVTWASHGCHVAALTCARWASGPSRHPSASAARHAPRATCPPDRGVTWGHAEGSRGGPNGGHVWGSHVPAWPCRRIPRGPTSRPTPPTWTRAVNTRAEVRSECLVPSAVV